MIDFTIPNELTGDKIILRRPAADFKTATMLFSCIDRNRDHLRKWMEWTDKTKTPEDSFVFLQGVNAHFDDKTKGEYFVIERATGDFCGLCSMHVHNGLDENIEIGYWLDKTKCGHGFIAEGVRLLETLCFTQNVMRIIIHNDTANTASVNVAKRAGYHLDGVLRAAFYSDYFKNYRDKNVFSKLNPALGHQRG